MKRNLVDSSMITSIGYDTSQSVLEIEFKSSSHVWQYYNVPENVWFELESASSLGRYFNENIRGAYVESRVE